MGAWWGAWIGDALAMPAHWYYHSEWIGRDYGTFDHYKAPLAKHPDSIFWRSNYQATGPKDDILHEQAQYWGLRGVHYHQFLKAGENTLNLKLAMQLAESLHERGGYDREDYISRYLEFLLTPGNHRDTYVEEYHRGFFKNYAAGKPPAKCGINDQHIGGLATLVPLILFYHDNPEQLAGVVREHVSLTHKNEDVLAASQAFACLLSRILAGASILQALKECGPAVHPCFSLPFERWAHTESDERVVGRRFSTACYIKDAFPASIYLAVKYEGRFREGLQANTLLGGDNCHRGVVIGALLGAAGGVENIPERWIKGLHDHPRLADLAEKTTRFYASDR